MIKLSCNTALIPNASLDEILAYYREIGITRVELIQFMHGEEVEKASAGELSKTLERHGQELIALYCRPIDVWAPDRLEKSLAVVLRAVHMAQEMGAERVVFPPLLPRAKYDYAALAVACERLLEDMGDRQVKICLENHHNWPMDVAEDYRKVIGKVTDARLGIAMDTGHLTSSEADIPAFIREFAPRIYHVHIKDHIGTKSVPLGKGTTDNVQAMQKLRGCGYEGYASIELEVEDRENVKTYLRDAVRYCREELGLV